jgi:hypothetical protein
MKIGDMIYWNGKIGRITNYSGTGYIVYVTDETGSYHIDLHHSQVSSYETIVENLEAFQQPTSIRKNEGKSQCREIDPNFILSMAEVLTKSQQKYDQFNWQKPTKLSTPYDSLMRHILAFQQGEDIDPDDGLPHLTKAAINLMFMAYHLRSNPEYADDRGFKGKKK